jgi:tyrosine-specific transport protein
MGKLIGTTLLVIGTAIGGGMLALPTVTANSGFWSSSLLLVFAWGVMTVGAFLLAEVNLWLHEDNNIVSMAKHTLGKSGAVIAWICYLALLYALVAAYISGGSGVVQSLFIGANMRTPHWVSSLIFTAILGAIVWHGIRSVDHVNRVLMTIKLLALVLLIILITPHVKTHALTIGNTHHLLGAITVVITSFGFATNVPTICAYLKYDAKTIRRAIMIGSIVTLCCYLIWDAIVQGSISGHWLTKIASDNNTTAELTQALSQVSHSPLISFSAHLFASICMLTSFLGVSIGLSDFLSDGFKIKKQGNKLLIYGITFLPPLAIALFYPQAFITALSYAGIFCLILLALLPSLMAWYGRYHKKLAKGYQVFGGKSLVIAEMVIASALLVIVIVQKIH